MKRIRRNEYISRFLRENTKRKPVSFHMPGHKYGRFPYELKTMWKHDITEIPGADNMKEPQGIIKKSSEFVSQIYGSDETVFLTNGTTTGILAIMKYAALKGGSILLSRNCHMSAINGAALFGVKTVFAKCDVEKDIAMPVTPDEIRKCINKNKDVCGILVVSPNYYGMCADLQSIVKIAQDKKVFLAVDEAHGSHFNFSGIRNKSALAAGADIVCHSLHKTMPVYNQGSILHVTGERVDKEALKTIISMLGTSSPSYPILESMERAVYDYYLNGEKHYTQLTKKIQHFKQEISNIEGLYMVENHDFTRLVIDVSKKDNGCNIFNILSDKYAVDMETWDNFNIVGIATPSNRKKDFKKLVKALKKVKQSNDDFVITAFPDIPEKLMEIHEALKKNAVWIDIDKAFGAICGTMLVPYPPGIPLVCPGEKLSPETIEFIQKRVYQGQKIIGIRDNKILILEQ